MSPQTSAELTAAVRAANGQPLFVTDPTTNDTYCITGQKVEPEDAPEEVPPGIRAAQERFWAALPDLLKDRKMRGKWVLFGPDGLIRASARAADLYGPLAADRVCRYIARVEPLDQPPWEPELVFVPD